MHDDQRFSASILLPPGNTNIRAWGLTVWNDHLASADKTIAVSE